MVQFEWDKEKAKRNYKKHGVSFEEGSTVFYDPLSATFEDPDHSDDEPRLITIGFSLQGRLLVVSHTERGKAIRIISTRPATKHERKKHEN
ncbi:MAG: BrnT family toxin [bacterium]